MKNHVFLMDYSGTWRLWPAYDLSFSAGPGGEHHLSVNGNGRNPTRQDLIAMGKSNRIRERHMREIIEQVRYAAHQWSFYAEASGVSEFRIREITHRLTSVDVK